MKKEKEFKSVVDVYDFISDQLDTMISQYELMAMLQPVIGNKPEILATAEEHGVANLLKTAGGQVEFLREARLHIREKSMEERMNALIARKQ